jgi:hypothetical protein
MAGVAVQLAPVPPGLKAAGGLPLVLLCPGYALVAAIFAGRLTSWPERVLFSLGLSLAVAILGAAVLNWSPWGLQTGVWVGLFLGVTLAASLFAARRRTDNPERISARRSHLRLPLEQWALLGMAGVVTIAAVTLVRMPQPVTGVLGYTILWMTPDTTSDAKGIRLGVSSSELTTKDYRLKVTTGGRLILDWLDITLAPGEKWEQAVDLPQGQPVGTVEAVLYRLDEPGAVYRRVTLQR